MNKGGNTEHMLSSFNKDERYALLLLTGVMYHLSNNNVMWNRRTEMAEMTVYDESRQED